MTSNLRVELLLAAISLVWICASCKPEAPNLHAQQRPAASERAEAAKAAIAAGERAAQTITGLTAEQAGAVVARVGEHTITLGDVAAHIAQLPRSARSRYVTAEQRVELVRKLAEVELLAGEARGRGFDTDPVVQHTYKKALANELLRTITTDLSLGDITDADVAAYYAANKKDFVTSERRRCAVIYANTKEDLVAVASGLETAIAATPKAAKQVFGDWAREKSVDVATANVKGDLGWFDAQGLNTKGQTRVTGRMLDAVYALGALHSISAPLELESHQWVLTQLTGLEKANEAPMEEVHLEIKNALLKTRRTKAREAFIESLRTKSALDIDDKALAALPAPEAPPKIEVPRIPKPKLNPALFRRPVKQGVVKRPGQYAPRLKIERTGGKVPQGVLDQYLGPGQSNSESSDRGAP